MTLEERLRARFGAVGVRRRPGAGTVLPVQVVPYFFLTDPDTDAGAEPDADAGAGASTPPEPVDLGTDRAGRLLLGIDGVVRNHLADLGLPVQYVNASLAAFAAGLLALDLALPRIAGAATQQEAAAAYRELRETLLADDPSAFAERESWWPRVLDDLRHGFSVGASAAVEFQDRDGRKQILTTVGGPGRPHPEELLRQQLEAAGVGPEAVSRVYCELEPCVMPGHYCALWLGSAFPRAEFTHSFDYGDDAASRERGIRELMEYLAAQR